MENIVVGGYRIVTLYGSAKTSDTTSSIGITTGDGELEDQGMCCFILFNCDKVCVEPVTVQYSGTRHTQTATANAISVPMKVKRDIREHVLRFVKLVLKVVWEKMKAKQLSEDCL